MQHNEKKPFARINIFHLDNIGKLYALVDFYNYSEIADKFKENKIKIFSKCEDGELDIKIKFNDFQINDFIKECEYPNNQKTSKSFNIKIFLSKSMSIKSNATKFILNSNCINNQDVNFERLSIVFSVNSNIFSKNILFDSNLKMTRVSDCFEILKEKSYLAKDLISNNNNDNNKLVDDSFYLKTIKKIDCIRCSNNLFDFKESSDGIIESIRIKLLENFDYNYVDKLENLSCHESHTEDIIPNIEEKLKKT